MNYCLYNNVFDDPLYVGYIWSNSSLQFFFFLKMIQLQKLTSFASDAAILTVQVLRETALFVAVFLRDGALQLCPWMPAQRTDWLAAQGSWPCIFPS